MPTPSTFILGIILAYLIIVTGASLIGQSLWTALSAIGTIAAVLWAIYHQEFSEQFRRPKQKINLYELKPPHLRPIPTDTLSVTQLIIQNKVSKKL